jgi:hypothetical protein
MYHPKHIFHTQTLSSLEWKPNVSFVNLVTMLLFKIKHRGMLPCRLWSQGIHSSQENRGQRTTRPNIRCGTFRQQPYIKTSSHHQHVNSSVHRYSETPLKYQTTIWRTSKSYQEQYEIQQYAKISVCKGMSSQCQLLIFSKFKAM